MRSNPILFLLIVSVVLLLIDLYVFKGIRQLSVGLNSKVRLVVTILYWSVSAFVIGGLMFLFANWPKQISPKDFSTFYLFSGALILFYIPKLVFIGFELIEDILRLSGKVVQLISSKNNLLTNLKMISQFGSLVSIILFLFILHGIFIGKFNFKVNNQSLAFKNLPKAFDGYKIAQFSDLHLGSFYGHEKQVEKAVKLINEQEPDLILFTGDLVNNTAEECLPFKEIIAKLKAKDGKYSILGNHDYGDYVQWDSQQQKDDNLKQLIQCHGDCDFKILLNESVTLEKNGEKIALIGVENWGLPPFPQYGNLKKALEPVKDIPFKICMSHDPTHWSEQIVPETDIDLTLSGHTHGMQFAINLFGWSWSPVKWKYKNWKGLFYEDDQYLFVSIGLGFIGFPGRVGTPPEVVVFELKSAQ